MFFTVEPEIFKDHPDLVIGVLLANNISNVGNKFELADLLRKEEQKISVRIGDKPVIEHPLIASWREAYRRFGSKPSRYYSSIENMVRRNLKGHSITHINTLVDIYNTISLKYLIPVGGEDLDAIEGDLLLTIAGDNEKPVRLLGALEEQVPHPGEIIYRDKKGTVCRRWNWKEAERTKLTIKTRNAFLVTEGIPPVDKLTIEKAIGEMAMLINRFCDGIVKTWIVDRLNSSILIK